MVYVRTLLSVGSDESFHHIHRGTCSYTDVFPTNWKVLYDDTCDRDRFTETFVYKVTVWMKCPYSPTKDCTGRSEDTWDNRPI